MSKKLSAVLIVKNETKTLERCLKTIRWADEVVVYDTGSTDGTQDLARKLGARLFLGIPIKPFHFAEARNRANNKARFDWILSIDADEIVREGGFSKIRAAIDGAQKETAFLVTFINRAEGIETVRTIATQKIKLFRKDAWTWKYRVHERLEPLVQGEVGRLPMVMMEHLPEENKRPRHGQNIELLKLCVQENPEFIRAFRHLGLELLLDKKHEEAIPYFHHYIEKTEEDRWQKSQVMCHIGNCLIETKKLDEALEWFERAAKLGPERREPCYHAALGLIKACRLEEAVTWLERMVQVPESTRPNLPYDLPNLWGPEPHKMIQFCKDEIARAKKEFETSRHA